MEVDSGGIITQREVPVFATHTVESLSEWVKMKEHILYPRVMELLAAEDVALQSDGFVYLSGSTQNCLLRKILLTHVSDSFT